MSRFHSLKVKNVTNETVDAVSLAFEVPADLAKDYEYKQGQYLTLKFNINGEELRRSYSICSSPLDGNELRVAVKKVKDGRASTHINNSVKEGDIIEVMIPMGNFYTEMNSGNQKHYVLFAGGSGITPMMSILKSVLKAEPQSSVTLFYANNDEASIIFKKQLDEIAANNSSRIKIYHVLNNAPADYADVLKGIMTKEKCSALVKQYISTATDNEYFICGPGPMMENASMALKEMSINEERVHIEYFSSPATPQPETVVTATPAKEGISATIILDKETHEIVLTNNETILEGALRIGLDPPYACQGGSCCTCRALLEEGEVKMAVNYGLSSSEIKKRYILTCQSRPTTSKVTVNYDKG
jgi:ring-1,2-phenylacetyl-CoA epoxidase subunit PaaE